LAVGGIMLLTRLGTWYRSHLAAVRHRPVRVATEHVLPRRRVITRCAKSYTAQAIRRRAKFPRVTTAFIDAAST